MLVIARTVEKGKGVARVVTRVPGAFRDPERYILCISSLFSVFLEECF